MKLHLGCGLKKKSGWINVDIEKDVKPDVMHDLNKYPWPFKNNSVDEIYMSNVLEHLHDLYKVKDELYRISKHGCLVKIIVPHHNSHVAFNNPGHFHYFNSCTISMLFEDRRKFEITKLELVPSRMGALFPKKYRELISCYLHEVLRYVDIEIKVLKK
jgi:SAM-dependent methyltransferase